MKTLYSEVLSLDKLLQGRIEIKEDELSLNDIKFQVDGNTILHLYCLEEDKLKIILDFLEKNKKVYLNSILMKNKEGKTPLDISIENDSQRTTDLLLRSLSHLEEGNYSQQFYDQFPDLLSMNLKSFHEFLDSCYFQTVQMKKTQYLSMNSDEDDIMTAHPSCILDRNFFEKHTTEGVAEKAIRKFQGEIVEEEKKISVGQKALDAEKAKQNKSEKRTEKDKDTINVNNNMYRQDSQRPVDAENSGTESAFLANNFSKFDQSDESEENSWSESDSNEYEGGIDGLINRAKFETGEKIVSKRKELFKKDYVVSLDSNIWYRPKKELRREMKKLG
jgi:hypothetical protein